MKIILFLLTLTGTIGSLCAQLVQFELRTASLELGMDGPTASSLSPATGGLMPGGSITLDQSNNRLTITGLAFGVAHGFTDLQGTFVSAHIHNASGGQSVILDFDKDTGNDHSGTIVNGSDVYELTPSLVSDLTANRTYINFHSSLFTDGEIRGNLTVVPEPHHAAVLAGLGLLGFAAYRRFRFA